MARTGFENLRVYQLSEEIADNELTPKLSAYINSIGKKHDKE